MQSLLMGRRKRQGRIEFSISLIQYCNFLGVIKGMSNTNILITDSVRFED